MRAEASRRATGPLEDKCPFIPAWRGQLREGSILTRIGAGDQADRQYHERNPYGEVRHGSSYQGSGR
jgi:hypothetical protein